MKHRITLFMLVFVLLVGVLPSVAAQDNEAAGWDLSQELKFSDLGLSVKIPADWVYAATEKSGVYMGQTKEDVAAASDGDASTAPEATTVNVVALKKDALTEQVGADAKLEQYVDFLVKTFGMTEKDQRLEAPIVGHRSLTTLGVDGNEHGLIITAWTQGDWMVGAFLSEPDYDTVVADLASWAGWMKAITPLGAAALSETPVKLTNADADIYFPADWALNDKSTIAFADKSDLDNGTIENAMIFAGEQTLAQLQLKDDATLAEAVTAIEANVGVTPNKQEDFLLLGQPAVMFTGVDGTGKYVMATQAIVNGATVQIALVAANEEKMNEAMPTYLAVVQSLAKVKTE